MKVFKVINNNIVLIKDENGRETIAIGRGIGFGRKRGSEIDEKKIEKRFVMDTEEQVNQFTELVKNISREYLNITIEIIEHANKVLAGRANLSSSLYIALADHLNFAMQRKKQGMMFANPLLNEVRVFYPSEYLVGEFGIRLVEERLGVKFPLDEAASIALHIVNSEYGMDFGTTIKITNLIAESTEIVKRELGVDLDEQSLDYSRFVTHLKFLCQRIFTNNMLGEKDDLSDLIVGKYPAEYEVSRKIAAFIQEKYEENLTSAEMAFLTIHIRRVQDKED